MIKNIKKISIAVVMFILTYLIFLIMLAPANKIVGQLTLPKNIQIQGISGSIWSGEAKEVVVDEFILHQVRWQVNLASLMTFNPTIEVNVGNRYKSGPAGSLEITNITDISILTVKNIDLSIKTNEVLPYLNLPIDMTAQGDIVLKANTFTVGKPLCSELNGQLTWANAQVNAMEEYIELGSFAANLACENGAVAIDIVKENNLGLEFSAYIANKGKVSGQGYLTPGANFPEKIKPVLSFIGRADKQGRYKIRL